MKKILLSLLSLVVAMTMFAQSESVRKMNLIYDGQVVYSRHVSLIDSIKFIWEELAGDDVIGGGEVDSTKQLYVGVVAFNQNVRQMAITSDIEAVKTFINEQTNDKDATAFAYSVSRGNQLFDAKALPAFDKIFMLNFSDGTDNYSNMLWGNDGRMVSQRNVYDTARYDLQQRPALNSYALGFGNDVGFGANMQKVVMGSGSYFNATAASELQSTFNEIAKSMLASAKNVLLKTNPGYYINGDCKYFRFSFVAEGGYADTIYAQMDGYPAIGYTLTISKIANGYAYFDAPAKGIMDDATGKVHIPLNNLKFIKDGEELQYKYEIEVSFDGELYYEDVEEASTSEEIDKRIAVVLVLDCSTSMGDAFEPMKAAAVNFIETMEKMEVETPVEPETPEVPEGVITCAEAVAICQTTGETATVESYTIRGYVTKIKTVWSEQYSNITFWMADTKDGGQVLEAYRVKPVKAEEKNVKVGDYVSVKGTLVNYYGNTPVVNAGGTYTILVAAEGGETPEEPETPSVETVGDGTEANPFTVEDVIALNNTLSGTHYVKAYIVGQATGASFTTGLDMEAPFEGANGATQGTNLAIASSLTPDVANIIPVQLPKGELRDAVNLVEHPELLGKQVLICGELIKYFQLTGIKNPTSITIVNR